MNKLIFGGVDSADYGIYITSSDVFDRPSRDVSAVTVPGRNGDLLIDKGRYNNIPVTYTCWTPDGYAEKIQEFTGRIQKLTGYQELEDSYYPDAYRMAYLSGEISGKPGALDLYGSFKLQFSCNPKRYLKAGKNQVVFDTSGGVIKNPTGYTAQPLIRVYGNGVILIDSKVFQVSEHLQPYMDIDTELMEAFCGSTSLNQYLSLHQGLFPELTAGNTKIEFSAGITKIIVIPRWWHL